MLFPVTVHAERASIVTSQVPFPPCLVLKDRAGQDRSVREVQLQIADAVPEDRTAHFLLICGEGAVSAVLSTLAPAALVGIAGTL